MYARASQWMLFMGMLFIGCVCLTACSDDNPTPADKPEQGEQKEPESDENSMDPVEPVVTEADYTVLFYAHGGKNLDDGIVENIGQFYNAQPESFKKVKAAVQYQFSQDLSEGAEKLESMGVPCNAVAGKAYRFAVDGDLTLKDQFVAANELDKQGVPFASGESLKAFYEWGVQYLPAKKYVLVISDHGYGFAPHDDLPTTISRGILYDDSDSDRHFTAFLLDEVLGQLSVKPEVLYFDACLMNMMEIHYQLKEHCPYIIASSFIVPGHGGSYDTLVDLLADGKRGIEDKLTAYCNTCVDQWTAIEGSSDYHDMAVVRTSGLTAYAAQLKTFTDKLVDIYDKDATAKTAIDKETEEAYKVFLDTPYYDIDYTENIAKALPQVFGDLYDGLKAAYEGCIVQQRSSPILENDDEQVDMTVLLGVNGTYSVYTWADESDENAISYMDRYHWDGTVDSYLTAQTTDEQGLTYLQVADTPFEQATWGATGEQTYAILKFDQAVGWSRWLKANQHEPNWYSDSRM